MIVKIHNKLLKKVKLKSLKERGKRNKSNNNKYSSLINRSNLWSPSIYSRIYLIVDRICRVNMRKSGRS